MAEAIQVSRGGTIVPEWGNADRDESEKITVHYRFLSFAEQQELLRPDDVGKSFAYESRVLARMITRLDNLEVEENGKRRKVDDGEKLVSEPGLDSLAMELWLELRNRSAIDKKKSASGSSSGETENPTSELTPE
jgi:hypothetical protein